MKVLTVILFVVFLLTSCTSESYVAVPLSDENPNLLCFVGFSSEDFSMIDTIFDDLQNLFGDDVTIAIVNTETNMERYSELKLTMFPACIIFDSNRQEIYRTYESFDVDLFEPILTDLLNS